MQGYFQTLIGCCFHVSINNPFMGPNRKHMRVFTSVKQYNVAGFLQTSSVAGLFVYIFLQQNAVFELLHFIY